MFLSSSQRQSLHPLELLLLLSSFVLSSYGWTTTTPLRSSLTSPQTSRVGYRGRPLFALINSTTAGPTTEFDDYYLVQDLQSQYESHLAFQQQAQQSSSSTETTTVECTLELEAATATTTPTSAEVNRARLLLLGAAALYGTNFSLVKMMGESAAMPIGLSTMMRFGLAALATSPFLFLNSDGTSLNHDFDKSPELGAILSGLEVGMWNSVGYIAQAVGLETTLASKSAFLCSMAVVIVPLLDFLFRGKKLFPKQLTGVTLAIMGVGILELGGSMTTEPFFSSGDICSLIQPVALGIGFWRMEHAMRKYPDQALRSTAAQLLAVFFGSALYCAIVTQPAEWALLSTWLHDPMIWLYLLWTGVVTTALSVYMETLALKTLSAAETTLIFLSEPVTGSAFAAAVMGERFGPTAVAGSLLILTGCVFSNLGMDGIKSFLFSTEKKRSNRSNII
jgi:drug/metabolite transporter (DMT)-like permease